MTTESPLEKLHRLVGTWATEATHPARPGLVIHGITEIQWLEGRRFLILRARTDQAEFPDSISIIGIMGRDRVEDPRSAASNVDSDARPCMHYFDSRGVFRVFDWSIDEAAWRLWRNAPGFSQRFTGTFTRDGDTIDGRWELCRDDVSWTSDLALTYRRSR